MGIFIVAKPMRRLALNTSSLGFYGDELEPISWFNPPKLWLVFFNGVVVNSSSDLIKPEKQVEEFDKVSRMDWHKMSDELVLRFPNLAGFIDAYREIFNVVSNDGCVALWSDIRVEMKKMSGAIEQYQKMVQRQSEGFKNK